MLMVRAVIFDVDGTLVDSVGLHARAWQEAFQKFGKDVSFEAIRRQIGKGSDQLLPVFLSEEEISEFGKELDSYREDLYEREYQPTVKGFAEVRELLERVKADGKQVVLATSGEPGVLRANKRVAKIEGLADAETSSGDVRKSKPHPDIFKAAMGKLIDVTPAEVVAVGDTPYDAEAAGKIGLSTIGLTTGAFDSEELRQAGCVAVYQDPADLLAHYDQSPLND